MTRSPAEQRRIAEVLESAAGLREKRRTVQNQLDAFLRVLFLERFGDPATNPYRWPSLAFAALGENQDEMRLPVKSSPRRTGAYPLYRAGGEAGSAEQAAFHGERLLIAAAGVNLLTRQQPVVRVVRGDFSVDQHAHVIAANGRAELEYLRFAIELTELRPYLTGAAAPKLDRAGLERIPVPAPPLELQREFSTTVAKVARLQCRMVTSLQRLDELYTALCERAFAGELRVDVK